MEFVQGCKEARNMVWEGNFNVFSKASLDKKQGEFRFKGQFHFSKQQHHVRFVGSISREVCNYMYCL
jgi:hypothetical protein